jgi:hypothetical protein
MSFRFLLVVEDLHDAVDLMGDRFWDGEMGEMGEMEMHGE